MTDVRRNVLYLASKSLRGDRLDDFVARRLERQRESRFIEALAFLFNAGRLAMQCLRGRARRQPLQSHVFELHARGVTVGRERPKTFEPPAERSDSRIMKVDFCPGPAQFLACAPDLLRQGSCTRLPGPLFFPRKFLLQSQFRSQRLETGMGNRIPRGDGSAVRGDFDEPLAFVDAFTFAHVQRGHASGLRCHDADEPARWHEHADRLNALWHLDEPRGEPEQQQGRQRQQAGRPCAGRHRHRDGTVQRITPRGQGLGTEQRQPLRGRLRRLFPLQRHGRSPLRSSFAQLPCAFLPGARARIETWLSHASQHRFPADRGFYGAMR